MTKEEFRLKIQNARKDRIAKEHRKAIEFDCYIKSNNAKHLHKQNYYR